MTQQAQLPDGTILEFPDDTPFETIQRVVRQRMGGAQSAVPPAQVAPAAQPAQSVSTFRDVSGSLSSGILRGAAETVMLPVTLERLMKGGTDWLFDKGDNLVRTIMGAETLTQEQLAARRKAADERDHLRRVINGAQDTVRSGMDSVLHQPQTTAGEYARTIGEFAAPGGLPSRATRVAPTIATRVAEYVTDLAGNVIAPAIVSETAGQATKGTAAEPYARAAGGVTGAAIPAGLRAWNAPDMAVRRATGDLTPEQWARAIDLQNNPTGIRLTGPEAIAQATGGGTALPNLMRVVEGSMEGRVMTAPFFAQRPGQVDNAVRTLLDAISPQSAAPSTLGPRVSAAAERALADLPEGRALTDAIFGAGPRVSPLQAGETIQPELRRIFEGREGMRNALADADYEAARRSAPTIPVDDLDVTKTVRKPGYTRLEPGENPITGQPQMQPSYVDARIETPAMTSKTGPDLIQVDTRPVVREIDRLAADAKLETANALGRVRNMLFVDGGVDTGVRGLDNARREIGDLITNAKANGNMQAAEKLLQVQAKLDEALSAVPAYRRANEGFRAASQPLEPFQSPGMGSVIARDAFNKRFTLPPEDVPGALMSPSEARQFNTVATPAARTAMEGRIATSLLDKATDSAGNVSVEALFKAMRQSEDLLSQFPGVANRLTAVVDAAQGAAKARTGVLGAAADAKTTQEAANVLLPQNPVSGSAREQADAVARMAAQDNEAVRGTVRQALSDRFAKASTETQEGVREFAGTKFHKDIAGNPARDEMLDAIMRALPDAPADATSVLLDVLAATGRRKPIGSATAFNATTMAGDLGTNSPFATVFSSLRAGGMNLVKQAGDAAKRTALRRNIGEIADMFTDPQAVELIRQADGRGGAAILGEAIPRTTGQVVPLFYDDRR